MHVSIFNQTNFEVEDQLNELCEMSDSNYFCNEGRNWTRLTRNKIQILYIKKQYNNRGHGLVRSVQGKIKWRITVGSNKKMLTNRWNVTPSRRYYAPIVSPPTITLASIEREMEERAHGLVRLVATYNQLFIVRFLSLVAPYNQSFRV